MYHTLLNNEPHQYILINKQIHTTSTKCQYQAAASNPKWCSDENWYIIRRTVHKNKNTDPIITCNPWKPVVTKNVVP